MPLKLAYICFGGFNDHILHHLFPAVDRSLLPEMKGFLIEGCKEFGIVYKECISGRILMEFIELISWKSDIIIRNKLIK